MGLLDGKRLLITGVLTEASLGFGVAGWPRHEGAEIILTGVGNGMKHTLRTREEARDRARGAGARRDRPGPDRVGPRRPGTALGPGRRRPARRSGSLPRSCLGGTFMDAGWDDVAVAMNVSAYSLKALADVVAPLMTDGGSIVGLDFDNTVSWPAYDWMGVAKSALESTSRYLARYLGPQQIRVNLVAAGPIKTIAARSIPGFSQVRGRLGRPGPAGLGRQGLDRRWPRPAWRCCRTGSPRPPARSSTSTAGTTPPAPEPWSLGARR